MRDSNSRHLGCKPSALASWANRPHCNYMALIYCIFITLQINTNFFCRFFSFFIHSVDKNTLLNTIIFNLKQLNGEVMSESQPTNNVHDANMLCAVYEQAIFLLERHLKNLDENLPVTQQSIDGVGTTSYQISSRNELIIARRAQAFLNRLSPINHISRG